MERFVFTLMIMLLGISIKAQVVTFTYDTVGNRIKRFLSSPSPAEKGIDLAVEQFSSFASLNWHIDGALSDEIFEVQRSFEDGE